MPKTISRFIYDVVLDISNVLLGATGWLVDFLLDQKRLTTLVTTQNLSLATELWRANLAHAHRHVHADGTEHRRAYGGWG